MNEDEIRTKLEQNQIVMRRLAKQRREIDEHWNSLMADNIQMRHALDQFAIYRADPHF